MKTGNIISRNIPSIYIENPGMFFCCFASYQVLGEIIDELSVVQTLVVMEVVLEHGGDLV